MVTAVLCGAAWAAAAQPVPWLLDYAGKSTNALIWDKRARPLVNAHVPKALARDVVDALGGPPDPVIVTDKRYVSMSACVAHACPVKGFFWIDTATGAALGANYDDGALRLGSNDFAADAVPEPALKALRDWIAEEQLRPASVEFIDRQGKSSKADVAAFAPPARFVPPEGGPSFDCAQAGNAIERAICGTPALALADLELTKLYTEIRHGHDTLAARAELQALQRQWLRERDKQCRAAADLPGCLLDQYRAQHKRLMNWLPGRHASIEPVENLPQTLHKAIGMGDEVGIDGLCKELAPMLVALMHGSGNVAKAEGALRSAQAKIQETANAVP
ncbi:DUF1311 domain-containing protein [Pseudoduganella flava]|nr:DUF1311 domain-containing protein [Pseudoduganella flava]